ncbi:MAG: site-specific integrase [bacterium]|nr:site-specific integrase [bacterium]MBK8131049.1 site-specific integrase [bacterium]
MATIYKRGKFWHAQFSQNGKLMQRSLGVTSKKLAEVKLGEIIRNLELGIVGLGKHSISNERAFQLFQTEVLDKKSPPWRKRQMQHLMHFQTWIENVAKANFSDLRTAEIDEFMASRRPLISDKTWNDELATLKMFYKWAEEREYIRKNAATGVKRYKVDPKAVRIFTKDEIALITKHATPYQLPFYSLLLTTGLRDGELRNLEWSEVDFENGLIFVRIKKSWQPKTRRGRAVPMAKEAREILHGLPRRGSYVFTTANGKAWAPPRQPWCDLLDRIYKKEGIDLRGQVSLHTFRHTFATVCLMSGIDIKVVSEYLGHTSVKMTEKYLHLLPEHKSREMQKVNFQGLLAGGHGA